MPALSVIEKKVLGALLILADDDMVATATKSQIANVMGYKEPGGAITFAIKMLEINNYITQLGDKKYKVMIE